MKKEGFNELWEDVGDLPTEIVVEVEEPRVTQNLVDDMMSNSEVIHEVVYERCVLTTLKTPQGFILSNSSCSISKDNFSKEYGIEMNLKKIEDKLWELLAFHIVMITAKNN